MGDIIETSSKDVIGRLNMNKMCGTMNCPDKLVNIEVGRQALFLGVGFC